MKIRAITICMLLFGLALLPFVLGNRFRKTSALPADRAEVVFWHFWGGQDQEVVESVVRRFNNSQREYFVRAIAMPGNNMQAKLFLSVAGGDPPDLVNQDDPVLPDWARRGVIYAMDEIADPDEVASMRDWLLPAARRLSEFDQRMYGVCNGLDIRALYFNRTALAAKGLQPPHTISQLDEVAAAFTSVTATPSGISRATFGYLPDSRRLWAWGFVFGGDFFDPDSGQVQLDTPAIRAALNWMTGYPRRYGADEVATFRKGDQSLPGKTFPLLPIGDEEMLGRYVLIMDGQWRVRDILTFQNNRKRKGLSVPEFGVCPLPVPAATRGGVSPRDKAGWVNGNFFVVPRGARNPAGAWEFMKFWIGYSNAREAARTCVDGGWIPVSESVIRQADFQDFLKQTPLFTTFVELATSANQFPTPSVPGAAMFRRTVENAAYEALTNPDREVAEILMAAESRIQSQLRRVQESIPDYSANRQEVSRAK